MKYTLTFEKLQEFIKWSMLELATNTSIDNRNYCKTSKPKRSLLAETIRSHNGDFNLGIEIVSKQLCEDLNIIKLLDVVNELSANSDFDPDDVDDYLTDFFNHMITKMGLEVIDSLHADSVDKFHDKLKFILQK